MAIVTAIKSKTQSKTAMRKVIDYVLQPHKTNFNQPKVGLVSLISGQNCVAETAFAEFMATKLNYGKDNGVFYKHFVQSFKPNKTTTPQKIHQIAVELAEYFKGFEVLIATHIDADHWYSHFIANMEQMGYKVKWVEHHKYITYTIPEGQKCRDNKLHDEKYLKERMEKFYELRQIESLEQVGKLVRGIQPENSVLRNSPRSVEHIGSGDDGSRKALSAHAGKNCGASDMDGLDGQYSADSRKGNERAYASPPSVREQLEASIRQSDGNSHGGGGVIGQWQNFQIGAKTPSTGQHTDQAPITVDRNRSIDTDSIIGADTVSKTSVILEAVGLIENLLAVNEPPKEEKTKWQVTERKNRHKKKQSHEHEWGMSL